MENIKYREHYLKKIEPFMGTSLIKVMTGQRRVGKSYILFQLIELIRKKESGANVIYINLEDITFFEYLKEVLPQNKTHEQQERLIGNILSEMKEIGLIHPEGRTWFLKS